jgi:hypothetical protein
LVKYLVLVRRVHILSFKNNLRMKVGHHSPTF